MAPITVLVVEDDPVSREILVENLTSAGFLTDAAEDGVVAWELLEANTQRYSAVLLDRLMPRMSGLEVLQRMKNHGTLRDIPAVLQTSMMAPEEIAEGLQAGAYYYLSKPFAPEALLTIVRSAVDDYNYRQDLKREVHKATRTMLSLRRAEFIFRTPAEARDVAALAAGACEQSDRVVLGLSELMLNAIEHGNLGITYQEKSELMGNDRLEEEIELRLARAENAAKVAQLFVENEGGVVSFRVVDQGRGFDWSDYLEMQPERAFDAHGRGIAMARMLSFDSIEYRGCGNEVVATVFTAGSRE